MSAEDADVEEAVDYEADVSPETGEADSAEATESTRIDATVDSKEPIGDAEPDPEGPAAELAQELAAGTTANRAAANDTKGPPLDPDDPLSLPPFGTEVFIGGIPRNASEGQVKAFAEQVGEVHSVKLAKDPNNPEQNRGFGFVRYFAKECADAAKEKLHETEMKDTGTKVRVSSSQAKHKVYVGNIPRAWTKEQLTSELKKHVKGLEGMDLVMSREVPNQNRGFAFLAFYNPECAAAAKDSLSKPGFTLDSRQLTVSYAEPKTSDTQQQQNQQATQQSKAVYIGNLPPGASNERIKEIFSKWGEVAKVVIPPATEKRPEQKFGFVHFADQSSANKAVADAAVGEKPDLNGNALEIKAARPQGPPVEPRQGGYGGYEDSSFDSYGGGFGGPTPMGMGRGLFRGGGRIPGRGSPALAPRGRSRGSRGVPYGRGGYSGGYDPGYDPGYGGYDPGYDQGIGQGGAYGAYSNSVPMAAAAASPAGMTMVPMMLPSGQVGYVLQSVDASVGADYGTYSAAGPDRGYGAPDAYGRGRGRGASRYRPY